MKRSIPIIAGALVFGLVGVLVFFLLAAQNDDESEIISVTTRYLAERFTKPGYKEGEAFLIEKVFILVRKDAHAIASGGVNFADKEADIEPHYVELEKAAGHWHVLTDLHDSFRDYMKQASAQTDLSNRLARMIMERFSITVEIPVGLSYSFGLGDETQELFQCEGCGAAGATEEAVRHGDQPHERSVVKAAVKEVVAHVATRRFEMGLVDGQYFESFRYRGRKWVSDGTGRLVEKPR